MTAVTVTDVKAIMKVCKLLDAQITVFINSAHAILVPAFASSSVTDAQLNEIEKWFVAHMIASVHYRTASTEKVGDVEIIYGGKLGEALKSTPYGQMVLGLDTTGTLAKLGKQAAKIKVINQFKS